MSSYVTCEATGKRGWPSRKMAKAACRKVRNRFRIYWCQECHHWHVTSEPRSRRG